ncbi:MAG: diguanylate cyclase [Anaerosporomusa subterranea]|nr:diguanylate cyclase [Anaerosporomusa subterranea]
MWLWSRPESLQRKIIGFILVISFFLLALSVFIVYIARDNYENARNLEQTSQITRELTRAVRDLALERGRMNVVLRSMSPISEENRNFIETRRRLSEEHLNVALEQLASIHPPQAADLAKSYAAIVELRQQVDTESRKSYEARQPGIARIWLKQATDFIYRVENVLLHLGRARVDSGKFFLYHQLVLDSLSFRQLAGHHATSLTTVLVRPDAVSPQQYDEIAFFRMQADSLWSGIEIQVTNLADPEITKAKEQVFLHYYNEYRPEQELQLSVAQSRQVDSDSVAHLQKLSVSAFDTIYLLIDVADSKMQEYVNGMLVKAKWLFIAGIGQFAACLLLVIFCITYFEQRLFRPLQRIIYALEQLGSNEEICILNEELQRPDEIGQINKGVQRLQTSIAEERRLMTENEHLAMTDFLTGCLNKRGFYLLAEAELSRAARENMPISFLFSDLDDLKQLNDSYGHLIGDEAVKHFAACVTSQCRPYDLIGRFGGDEFVFCFPNASEEQALKIVKRIQTALEKSSFQVGETDILLQLSASFGLVANVTGEDRDLEWFIHQADMALYKAKQNGKNCVMLGVNQNGTFC